MDEILLAALGRTIAATVGEGTVAVDLEGQGRSVLKPDVDLHRTVGWFTTIYPVALTCANRADGRSATAGRLCTRPSRPCRTTESVMGCCDTCMPRPHGCSVHPPPADILFSYVGTIPDLPHERRCSGSVRRRHGYASARGGSRPRPRDRTPGVSLGECASRGLVVRQPPTCAAPTWTRLRGITRRH